MYYLERILVLYVSLFCCVLVPAFSQSCSERCLTVSKTSCKICAQLCQNSFLYKSCQQTICTKTSNSKCIETQTKQLSQSRCASNCCMYTTNKFTYDTLSQCLQIDSTSDIGSDDKTIIIVCVSVFVGGVLAIVIGVCNCWRKRLLCFNNQQANYQNQPTVTTNIASGTNLNPYAAWNSSVRMHNSTVRQTNCSICLQAHINCKTSCGHDFHFKCIKQWIRKKQSCPNCVSERFNPLILICDKCNSKNLTFKLTQENRNRNHHFIDKNQKIICDQCLEQGRTEVQRVGRVNKKE